MKSFLSAIFTGALLCAMAVAQDATPPPSSSPQQSPTTQAPANEQTAQPSPSGSQQTPQPTTPPSDTAQPQAPSRQAPSGEQAAQPSSAGSQATGATRVAPGSVIPVQLTKTIDAKKAKTGDEVVAKVTQDMKTNSGDVIFAKDTKVLGHVTEAQPRSKEQKESQVGIAFDRAVMKNGSEMQVPMSIQAIIGPQNSNPNSGAGQAPEAAPAGRTGGTSGRASGMGGAAAPPTAPSSGGGSQPGEEKTGSNARPPITAETQGVVGMPDLKLESAGQNPTQGSLVSSEKNNVKIDSGTLLLLRVNQ
jgi:hypothetical protein